MSARHPMTQLDEKDVGIYEYVNAGRPGVGGVLKMVADDFQVNELRLDGSEVVLEEQEARQTDSSGENADPSDEDDFSPCFVKFVLRKERWDTLGAIAELAGILNVPARRFSIAGLKDYRAITTQEVVVRGISADAVRDVDHAQLRVGSVRRCEGKLRLGGCGGNRFRIRIRRVRAENQALERALRGVRKRGFINYYGLQRFGGSALRNDEVGLHTLAWRYEEAVDALLRARDGSRISSAELEARDCWFQSRNARVAHCIMPKSKVLEKELLRRLAFEQNATLSSAECARAAFLGLPLSQRRLFAHAYFSKVWNLVVSERFRRFGHSAAQRGELVMLKAESQGAGRRSGRRRGVVHEVSEAEAEAEVYSVRKVVLPLPGSGIRYPDNELGSLYRSLLAHDDVDPYDVGLEVAATCGDETDDNCIYLAGDHRHILLCPKRMSWSVEEDSAHDERTPLADGLEAAEGSERSVLVQFDLPPGAYATMALREVMKLEPPSTRQRHIRF